MNGSLAISDAIGTLEEYELSGTSDPALAQLIDFLDQLADSTKRLHLSTGLLAFASRMEPGAWHVVLSAVLGDQDVVEHLAATLGKEALDRAEIGVRRLVDLADVVPPALPPERSRKYLSDALACYLLGLDHPCVAMCRAAVEVLAEDLDSTDGFVMLGARLKRLVDSGTITGLQKNDMWAINEQAKEVLHDEVARVRPDAKDCLIRLSRLLREVHPHTSGEAPN